MSGRCWDCGHTAPLDDDGCCTRCGISQELSYKPSTAEIAVRRLLSYLRRAHRHPEETIMRHIIHDPAISAKGRLFAPVEVLRSVTRMCDRMPESFNQRFTIAELVRLWQVAQLCEWDYDPHQWSEDQIADALGDGIIPTFDED